MALVHSVTRSSQDRTAASNVRKAVGAIESGSDQAADAKDDRRTRIPFKDDFPFVGLLRMEFSGRVCTGTATMIADGSCALTCAHNVIDCIYKDSFPATSGWFELRRNEDQTEGSTVTNRYRIVETQVYPKYFEAPTSNSGFDLALCWIEPENDTSSGPGIPDLPTPTTGVSDLSGNIALIGFPGEKKGEKWGMSVAIPMDKKKDWTYSEEKKILVYDFIDTSPGQAGSPIMHLGMEQGPYQIVGIHTGGSQIYEKKWGTFITRDKLEWIACCLGRPWKICTGNYNQLYLGK